MIVILICCFLILNTSEANAAYFNNDDIGIINVLNRKRNYEYYYPQISQNDLSALEKYTLNRTFSRENPLQRLERLETLAFGSSQSGDLRMRYQNVEQALLSRPAYRTRQSKLNNIMGYFAGQPTGVTPQVQNRNFYTMQDNFGSFNNYPSYGTQRIDQFSNGMFGGGYRMRNSGFGNGSSITILP